MQSGANMNGRPRTNPDHSIDHIKDHLLKRCIEGVLPSQSWKELGYTSYNIMQKILLKHRVSMMEIRREAHEAKQERIKFERLHENAKKTHETRKLKRGTRAYARHNKSKDPNLMCLQEFKQRLGLTTRTGKSFITNAKKQGKLEMFSQRYIMRDSAEAMIADALERRKIRGDV
jgi:hypothetical protein